MSFISRPFHFLISLSPSALTTSAVALFLGCVPAKANAAQAAKEVDLPGCRCSHGDLMLTPGLYAVAGGQNNYIAVFQPGGNYFGSAGSAGVPPFTFDVVSFSTSSDGQRYWTISRLGTWTPTGVYFGSQEELRGIQTGSQRVSPYVPGQSEKNGNLAFEVRTRKGVGATAFIENPVNE